MTKYIQQNLINIAEIDHNKLGACGWDCVWSQIDWTQCPCGLRYISNSFLDCGLIPTIQGCVEPRPIQRWRKEGILPLTHSMTLYGWVIRILTWQVQCAQPHGNHCWFLEKLTMKPLFNVLINLRPLQWQKIMNILRPLSPHLTISKLTPIARRYMYSFLLLTTHVIFMYFLFLKIGLICFTYKNFYQFFFFSSKLMLIGATLTALALSYHLFSEVHHLLKPYFSRYPFITRNYIQEGYLILMFLLFGIYNILLFITVPLEMVDEKFIFYKFFGEAAWSTFPLLRIKQQRISN